MEARCSRRIEGWCAMSFWGWVQAIATGWMTLSILLAVAWALGGKKIFRPRPAQPTKDEGANGVVFTGDFETDLRQLDRRRGGER